MTRLPEPAPAVRSALRLLPHEPGVYLFREQAGRVLYVGRSRDLASRARSYWVDLKDRPHLTRMLGRVAWLEPVLCASEHEAAFLESDLLERHATRYNRTLGVESCVWLRLDADRRRPTLEVIHDPEPADGAAWFGPYLGWEPVRQAAAGLKRLYPLHYSGTELSRTDFELARSLGVAPGDAAGLARRISRVLKREPHAVRIALGELEAMRDRAAEHLMFEQAGAISGQMRGLRWITEPQKFSTPDAVDGDYAATHGGVRVVLELRRGRLSQRHVERANAAPEAAADGHGEWMEMARANARLMASFVDEGALGPVSWRR